MGIHAASDMFQSTMLGLFIDLEGVIAYINDIIIIRVGTFEYYMPTVDDVLGWLRDKGIQVNPLKRFWGHAEVEYLDFLVTREGIRFQQGKNQGIVNIVKPKTTKQLRGFVGMVNYYKSM